MTVHVPAWQRLGLKLKISSATSANDSNGVNTPDSAARKRKKANSGGQENSRRESSFSPAASSTPSKIRRRALEDAGGEISPAAKKRKSSANGTEAEWHGSSIVSAQIATPPTDVDRHHTTKAEASHSKSTSLSSTSDTVLSPQRSKEKPKDAKRKSISGEAESQSATTEFNLTNGDGRGSQTLPLTLSNDILTPITPANGVKRRKSVAFTPDTKIEDGNSAQELYKEWVKEQEGLDAQFSLEEILQFTEPPKIHPANLDANASVTRKPSKKDKKTARKDRKAQENAQAGVPSYLQYLQEYHTDRSAWKFNKNKQIDLLKNLLNTWKIPAEQDEALMAYMAGLKGSAARQLVREKADTAMQETNELIDCPCELTSYQDVRSKEYEEALRAQLKATKRRLREAEAEEKEEEYQHKLKKRKRAADILLALAASEPAPLPKAVEVPAVPSISISAGTYGNRHQVGLINFKQATRMVFSDVDETPSITINGDKGVGVAPAEKKKPRKRKQRTGVPDDDSSDSDNSVSSVPSAATLPSSESEAEDEEESSSDSSDSKSSSSSSSSSSEASENGSDEGSGDESDNESESASEIKASGSSSSSSSSESGNESD